MTTLVSVFALYVLWRLYPTDHTTAFWTLTGLLVFAWMCVQAVRNAAKDAGIDTSGPNPSAAADLSADASVIRFWGKTSVAAYIAVAVAAGYGLTIL